MATGSETFFATCVLYWTCSAILNILKSDEYHQKGPYSVKSQGYSLKRKEFVKIGNAKAKYLPKGLKHKEKATEASWEHEI